MFGQRAAFAALSLCAAALATAAAGAAPVADAPATPPAVMIEQEALRTALPRLGSLYGVRLRAGRGLAEQRVTLMGKNVSLEEWKRSLTELLSYGEEGRVFWSSQGEVSILEDSHRRRLLAAALAAQESNARTEALLKRVAAAVEKAKTLQDGQMPSEDQRRLALLGFGGLLVLNATGEAGIRALCSGESRILRAEDVRRAPYGDLIAEWLEGHNWRPDAGDAVILNASKFGGTEQMRSRFLLMVADREGFPRSKGGMGGGVTETPLITIAGDRIIFPQGQRGFAYNSAEMQRGGRIRLDLSTPVPGEDPKLPLATLNLAPSRLALKPGEKRFQVVSLELHTLLRRIHRATGTTIVADGYLRPRIRLDANLEARNVPVQRLVTRLAETYDAGVRIFRQPERPVVLLRANRWWDEDSCNVPAKVVTSLASKLDGRTPPKLEALAELARLTEPQIYRLTVQTELAPGGARMIHHLRTEGNGAHHFLHTYSALPPPGRAQAVVKPGVLLDDYPGAKAVAAPALIRYGGAHHPDLLNGVRLRVDQDAAQLTEDRCRWNYTFWFIGNAPSHVLYAAPMSGVTPFQEEPRDENGDPLAAAGPID